MLECAEDIGDGITQGYSLNTSKGGYNTGLYRGVLQGI